MVLKDFIWDFDGTLYDTYPVMTQALVTTLHKFGVTKIDVSALYRDLKIRSVRAAQQTIADQNQLSVVDLATTYHQIEHQAQQTPQPYPGAAEVLQTVIAHGGRNFLDTHRDQTVYDYLAQNKLSGYFSGGIDASQNFPRKPDPSAINAIIKQYQLDPATTVMVGDRRLDIDAGLNAQIQTIYFNVDGYNDAPYATYQVNQLADILALLA
ncbi:HAD-IA family hydrolase [Lapidilactobacillus bayanensis]|uniref:HAD-IA family hydrolase n=1 Tax=Lapidilactobacillus bayanensis TaxID=2485998 RepID=UPI000F778F82|nr:HAD-IA family hydrolase [Lapidilactobacillus bayanensis]